MNCNEARKWLSPYIDSELGQTKTFEVGEHLNDCPPCAQRFDAEREVDQAIRRRLEREVVPSDLWQQITHQVPVRRRVWPFLSRGRLALAACLMFVVFAVPFIWERKEADQRSWLVQQFAAATPHNEPFTASTFDLSAVSDVLSETLGVAFRGKPAAVLPGHTGMKMVSAERRVDAGGHAYVELRLNCCNQPVLLLLARPQRGAWPAPIRDLNIGLDATTTPGDDGILTIARDVDGLRAVAVSRHPVEQVVANLSFIQQSP